jgi:hypothetical protein
MSRKEDRLMAVLDTKQAILEIIRKSDGEFTGKTRLHKALYFAHLIYFEMTPACLTDCEFARLPQGPGIHNGNAILKELEDTGLLAREVFHDGPYLETRYRLTAQAKQTPTPFPAKADLALQRAVDFVRGKSAAELSQYTHEYSKSWNLARREGELLDIYIDVIPDDEFERREKKLQEMEPMFEDVLKALEG